MSQAAANLITAPLVQLPSPRFARRQPTAFLDPATITERFYGLVLSGHCLDPEFKDGDKVVFDQDAPLENGCFANFFYRPEVVKPGQLSIALKKLVFAPPPFVKFPWRDHPESEVIPVIIVAQLNPRQSWSIRCSDLLTVHRCLGRADDPAVKRLLEAEGWQS